MAERVAIVGVFHETNSYAATVLTLDDFAEFELLAGEAIRESNDGVNSVIGGFFDGGRAEGFDLVPVFSASAWPSGPCTKETLDEILARIVDGLRAAGPYDAVLLNLHGAMAVPGVADVEGTIVAAVREVVGDLPISAVVDFHANVSAGLVQGVDAMVAYETYPHVDMGRQGSVAAGLLGRLLRGEELATTLGRLPFLTVPMGQATAAEPMRGLIDRANARATEAGLARISLTPGFPYSDVTSVGFSVFTVAGPHQHDEAVRVIEETLADVAAHADEFMVQVLTPADGVALALAAPIEGSTMLVDVADNVGGGSSGDSVAILAELVKQGATGAAVTIADTEVALAAHEAGVGGSLTMPLGGKTDDLHGDPLELTEATVLALTDGDYVSTTAWMKGRTFHLGRSALLDVEGVEVLVTEHALPPFHADQLRTVGIEPAERPYLTAKSAIAWRDAFGFAAREVLIEGPGACPVTIERLPRQYSPEAVAPR